MPQIAARDTAFAGFVESQRVNIGPGTSLKTKYEESTSPAKSSTISLCTIKAAVRRRGSKLVAKSVEGVFPPEVG